ncbi:molybdenum cofactor guanylyltransferase [Saccharopolyspora sp. HNM0986]|uniref:molybdenum cofactor guanylyltransferase n=1 Tax=Saccharopolyspora galaxeae TaxID=2781241 RepID=UPI00190C5529|nr:molybdenum cofactor guanylyltransferase [Saccharopolyspora sp. HNM0986]MBK0869838.1 molybdenum cofactor guanylyltransferase [Saccharopolyspora sp. HNM0986]
MTNGFAAVVLAGGEAKRLGGVDKLALRVGGRTLLDRTLAAVGGAEPIVIVGPERPVAVPVRWAREDPPRSGPLAGLHAGLREVPREVGLVAVVAADHPGLTASTIDRLRAAVRDAGAVLIDSDDRPQWLLGVWRAEALREHMPAEVVNRPVRDLLAQLEPARVPATGTEASDVDTPDDYRRLT